MGEELSTKKRNWIMLATKNIAIVSGTVVGGIIIIFFILNFFNVIRVSSTFPSFSVLPHLTPSRSLSFSGLTTKTSPLSSVNSPTNIVNKTFYSRATFYIGQVIQINGTYVIISNMGSTFRANMRGKLQFGTFPASSTSARLLNLSQDIHIGDLLRITTIQVGKNRPIITNVDKMTKAFFDSINTEY